MRLVIVVLASCLIATAACLASLYLSARFIYGEAAISYEELTGFAGVSFIFSLLTCIVLYAPGLYLLRRRRRGVCEPAYLFPLVSTLLLNIPVFLVLLIPLRTGLVSGWGEASLIFTAFLVAGFVFGLGFVWHCRKLESSKPPA
jgi:hypothetical protein